jgi:hypothetical protein
MGNNLENRQPGMSGTMKYSLPAFLLVLICMDGNAQFLKRPVILETKVHAGINLPFYDAVSYMMQDEIYGFDVSASFPSYGKDYWEKLYNYPRTGAGFSYWTLGNDEVFGKSFSLFSFINIPLLKSKEKFSFNCQVSAGGAWLTKRFDLNDNYLNRAIGSHANIYIRLSIDGKIKLSPCCEMVLETGTSHFSNVKNKSPNRGINAASVSLGINYLFFKNGTAIQEPEIPVIRRRFYQSVAISAGSKVYDNLLNKKYFVSSLYYNLERSINHKSKIGLGTALFYDGSISEALASEQEKTDKEFSDLIRFGLHGSYSLRYKQLILGIQAGYYLYSKYTDLTRIYSRFSLQYLLTEHIAGFTGLKTHYGKADFLEFGLMYYW